MGDPERAERAACGRRQLVARDEGEVVGRTEQQGQPERRQVGTQSLGAEERVHRDHAGAGAQETEEGGRARRAGCAP